MKLIKNQNKKMNKLNFLQIKINYQKLIILVIIIANLKIFFKIKSLKLIIIITTITNHKIFFN